jgi:hypothetical protein
MTKFLDLFLCFVPKSVCVILLAKVIFLFPSVITESLLSFLHFYWKKFLFSIILKKV